MTAPAPDAAGTPDSRSTAGTAAGQAATPYEAAERAYRATGDWEMAVEAALVAERHSTEAPRCPNGCGCRLGSEDADAADCACDGLCCYDEIEVSEVFAERDRLRAQLAAAAPAPQAEAGVTVEALSAALADVRVKVIVGNGTELRSIANPHYLAAQLLAMTGKP